MEMTPVTKRPNRNRKNMFIDDEARDDSTTTGITVEDTESATSDPATPANQGVRPLPTTPVKQHPNNEGETDMKCPICTGDIEGDISKNGSPFFFCQFQKSLHGPLPYMSAHKIANVLMTVKYDVHDDYKTVIGGTWPKCPCNDFTKLDFLTKGGKEFKGKLVFKCKQDPTFNGQEPCDYICFAEFANKNEEQDKLRSLYECAIEDAQEMIAVAKKKAIHDLTILAKNRQASLKNL